MKHGTYRFVSASFLSFPFFFLLLSLLTEMTRRRVCVRLGGEHGVIPENKIRTKYLY